jgi:hypothetical protein
MPLDFTLSKFRSLCSSVAQNYPSLTLAEYFRGKDIYKYNYTLIT